VRPRFFCLPCDCRPLWMSCVSRRDLRSLRGDFIFIRERMKSYRECQVACTDSQLAAPEGSLAEYFVVRELLSGFSGHFLHSCRKKSRPKAAFPSLGCVRRSAPSWHATITHSGRHCQHAARQSQSEQLKIGQHRYPVAQPKLGPFLGPADSSRWGPSAGPMLVNGASSPTTYRIIAQVYLTESAYRSERMYSLRSVISRTSPPFLNECEIANFSGASR
jgi:hypothetical protein